MNIFQQKCIESCKKLLERKGFASLDFHENIGRSEKYYTAELTLDDDKCKLYIYEDEAGFFLNKDWFICEAPDFKAADELIKDFCRLLDEKLSGANSQRSKK